MSVILTYHRDTVEGMQSVCQVTFFDHFPVNLFRRWLDMENLNETLATFLNQFSKFFPLSALQITGSSWLVPNIFEERSETDTLIVITRCGKVGGVMNHWSVRSTIYLVFKVVLVLLLPVEIRHTSYLSIYESMTMLKIFNIFLCENRPILPVSR
jgi:hypothetical protein